MYPSEGNRLYRQALRDQRRIEELLSNYRHPDPKMGATKETVPWFASLMAPQALYLKDEYKSLGRRLDADVDLRLQAEVNAVLAAELFDLLTDLAQPYVRGGAE